jgi:hypothetical protein
MIVPFFFSNSLRKIRHKIILGLGVTDFLQAVTVLVPTVYTNFGQRRLATDSPGCIADSFFYLTLVVSGCLWVLAWVENTLLLSRCLPDPVPFSSTSIALVTCELEH